MSSISFAQLLKDSASDTTMAAIKDEILGALPEEHRQYLEAVKSKEAMELIRQQVRDKVEQEILGPVKKVADTVDEWTPQLWLDIEDWIIEKIEEPVSELNDRVTKINIIRPFDSEFCGELN
jgi:enoyl reductase-like protein